jgi:hypothetical protein
MSLADSQSSTPSRRPGPTLLAHKGFLIALIVLSGVGVYMTDSFPAYGYHYWLGMGVVFALFNLFTAWTRSRSAGMSVGAILQPLLLHWGGFLIAVYVLFMIFKAGHMDASTTGMVTLLALALTTFLAGVHFDWRLCLMGLLLASLVVGGALVQRFLWMVVVPLMAAVALGIYWWLRREEPGTQSPTS